MGGRGTGTSRPTILLSTDTEGQTRLARSVNQVDLYQLVKDRAHLLHRFGGHPFAAGLSLPIENIPLFTDAINQRLRQILGNATSLPTIQADLVVTIARILWGIKRVPLATISAVFSQELREEI